MALIASISLLYSSSSTVRPPPSAKIERQFYFLRLYAGLYGKFCRALFGAHRRIFRILRAYAAVHMREKRAAPAAAALPQLLCRDYAPAAIRFCVPRPAPVPAPVPAPAPRAPRLCPRLRPPRLRLRLAPRACAPPPSTLPGVFCRAIIFLYSKSQYVMLIL